MGFAAAAGVVHMALSGRNRVSREDDEEARRLAAQAPAAEPQDGEPRA